MSRTWTKNKLTARGWDERVSLASAKRVTTAIVLFTAEWCGLERV